MPPLRGRGARRRRERAERRRQREREAFLSRVKEAYVTPGSEIAFCGRNKLYQHYGGALSQADVEDVLGSVYSYTLHREKKRPRLRNPYLIYRIRDHIQMDLCELNAWRDVLLPPLNDDIRYWACAIDGFSRRLWVVPMRRKDANASLQAIKKIMDDIVLNPPFRPAKQILFDRGTEFVNRRVLNYLARIGTQPINPNSEVKAGLIERCLRTIQGITYAWMTETESNRYIDVLPQLVETYNSRKHLGLGGKLSPLEAEDPRNWQKVLDHHIQRYTKIREKAEKRRADRLGRGLEPLRVGDVVRIVVQDANRFARSYHHSFSPDYFQVERILNRMGVRQFVLRSMNTGRLLRRRLYREQCQKITTEIYRIDHVVDRRVRGRRREALVKWMW